MALPAQDGSFAFRGQRHINYFVFRLNLGGQVEANANRPFSFRRILQAQFEFGMASEKKIISIRHNHIQWPQTDEAASQNDKNEKQSGCEKRQNRERPVRPQSKRGQQRHADKSAHPEQPGSWNNSSHRGTDTLRNTRSITSAIFIPSISYSGRRITRCSSVGIAMCRMSSGVTKSCPCNTAQARLPSNNACVARGPPPTSTLSCSRVARTRSTIYESNSGRTVICSSALAASAISLSVSVAVTPPAASVCSGEFDPSMRVASCTSSSRPGVSIVIFNMKRSFCASGSV